MCEGTTSGHYKVDIIGMKSITLNINFSLACTYYKLNFKFHMSKTCYCMHILARILYLKYLYL